MVIIYWLLLIVMLVGVAGAVIPGLPGSSLILAAILLWGFINGFSGMGFALGIAETPPGSIYILPRTDPIPCTPL